MVNTKLVTKLCTNLILFEYLFNFSVLKLKLHKKTLMKFYALNNLSNKLDFLH